MNEIKQIDWFDSHWYKIDFGDNNIQYYPSVTTKLQAASKPFLARWRGDIGNREADYRMNEAADRGSRIHYGWYLMTTGGTVLYNPYKSPNFTMTEIAEIEEKTNGILLLDDQGEMWDIYKLQQWYKAVSPKVEASELIVYSSKNQEAGQLDNLFDIKEGDYIINGANPLHIPEGRYVVDLKTGKVVPDDGHQQTAAYANCYGEMTKGKEKIAGTIIIHTGAKTRTGIEGLATYLRTPEQVKEDYEKYRAVAKVWEMNSANKSPKIFEFPSLVTLKS